MQSDVIKQLSIKFITIFQLLSEAWHWFLGLSSQEGRATARKERGFGEREEEERDKKEREEKKEERAEKRQTSTSIRVKRRYADEENLDNADTATQSQSSKA